MEFDQLVNTLNNYKKGTYIKLQYVSDVPVTCGYRNHSLIKVVSTVVRLGCSYKSVFKDWAPSENHKSWYHNIYENIVVQHNKQDRKYLKVYTTNNKKHTHIRYFLDGSETTEREVENVIKKTLDNQGIKMYLKDIEDIIKIGD